jgi:ribosomal protein S18 acetylase RimI-like enzyme
LTDVAGSFKLSLQDSDSVGLAGELLCPLAGANTQMVHAPAPHNMHPLDNVIWQALTTRQAEFALSFRQARRFMPEVTSLCAFLEPTEEGYESLAALAGPEGTAAIFLNEPYQPRPGWDDVGGAPLQQMVCANGLGTSATQLGDPEFVELSPSDVPEMLELATLTKPGPFGSRTRELGNYIGVRREGKLVAMAGERMKVPGHAEVSAVCTHPGHTGKGYAQMLMSEVMRRIRERGETPFLHVRQDNTRAIKIYERLGFRTRVVRHYAVLRRT